MDESNSSGGGVTTRVAVIPSFKVDDSRKKAILDWIRQSRAFHERITLTDPAYLVSVQTSPADVSSSAEALVTDSGATGSRKTLIFEEAGVEVLVVHSSVQLISILSAWHEKSGSEAANLLFQLGLILNRDNPNIPDADPVLFEIRESVERDGNLALKQSVIEKLWGVLAPMLQSLAGPLNEKLELNFNHPVRVVRQGCFTAWLNMLVLNKVQFSSQEAEGYVALLLNCFYLEGLSRTSVIRGIIKCLEIDMGSDEASLLKIIHLMFEINPADMAERLAVQDALNIVFHNLIEKKKSVTLRCNPWKVLLDFVVSQRDSSVELAPWAVKSYYSRVFHLMHDDSAKSAVFATEDSVISDFIANLVSVLRSNQEIIRCAAASSLLAMMQVKPELWKDPTVSPLLFSGLFDRSFLVSTLYLDMLDLKGDATLSSLIAKLRHHSNVRSYDAVYSVDANEMSVPEDRDAILLQIANIIAADGVPISSKTFAKTITAAEYLPLNSQLRQLKLLAIWGKRISKVDSIIIQSLAPLIQERGSPSRIASLDVLKSILPFVGGMAPVDIALSWSLLFGILSGDEDPVLLQKAFEVCEKFPLKKLPQDLLENLITTLLSRIFHKNLNVRKAAYQLAGSNMELWRSSGLFSSAITVIFYALGDSPFLKENVNRLIQNGSSYSSLLPALNSLSETVVHSPDELIRVADDLANAIYSDKDKLQEIIIFLTYEFYTDTFWDYFLIDVPENELVRVEDYNFNRNYVQSPHWLSLLMCKLGMTPPPPSGEIDAVRGTPPTTPAGLRRFHLSYMSCLLPSCGSSDPYTRRMACLTLVRCCFVGLILDSNRLRSLHRLLTTQMFLHKNWQYQCSAMEIVELVVRLKIDQITIALFVEHFENALDVLANVPSPYVKLATMKVIRAFVLVLPKGCASKVIQVREILRQCALDRDISIRKLALEVYQILCQCLKNDASLEHFDYLRDDIKSMLGQLSANDDLGEKEHDLIVTSILAMGCIRNFRITHTLIQELFIYCRSDVAAFREAAVTSIIRLLPLIDEVGLRDGYIWLLLPFYSDESPIVRNSVNHLLNQVVFPIDRLFIDVSPVESDSYALDETPLQDLLDTDRIDKIVFTALTLGNLSASFDIQSDFRLSAVNMDKLEVSLDYRSSDSSLMNFKIAFKGLFRNVAPTKVTEIVYLLQEMHYDMSISLLILSEFSCMHETVSLDVIKVLVERVSQNINNETWPTIINATLGLRNIGLSSGDSFKTIMSSLLSTSSTLTEGCLFCLLHVVDLIKEHGDSKIIEILNRFVPLYTNMRLSLKVRSLALFLSVDLAVFAGNEDLVKLLDIMHGFVEINYDSGIPVEALYAIQLIFQQMVQSNEFIHPIFSFLIESAKRDVCRSDSNGRIRALDIFRVFAELLPIEECIWFAVMFISDSQLIIRQRAQRVLGQVKKMTVLLAPLPIPVNRPPGSLYEKLKLPYLESVSFQTDSPVAIKYEFMQKDKGFQGDDDDFSSGMFDYLVKMLHSSGDEEIWGQDRSAVDILRALGELKHDQFYELLENYLKRIEKLLDLRIRDSILPPEAQASTITNPFEDSVNAENIGRDINHLSHLMEMFTNLLAASDNMYSSAARKRIEKLIFKSCTEIDAVSGEVFETLERKFYYFNDFLDVPIYSHEQYDSIERYKDSHEDATLELVKFGKADKIAKLEEERRAFEDKIARKGMKLSWLTTFVDHAISMYGVSVALSPGPIEQEEILLAINVYERLLDNENRNVRRLVVDSVDALVTFQGQSIKMAEEVPSRLQTLAQEALEKLEKNGDELYRRKVELLDILSILVVALGKSIPGDRVLQQVCHLWSDVNGDVRDSALRATKYLGMSGVPEFLSAFKISKPEESAQAKLFPNVPSKIAAILHNEDYGDKVELDNLLDWGMSIL